MDAVSVSQMSPVALSGTMHCTSMQRTLKCTLQHCQLASLLDGLWLHSILKHTECMQHVCFDCNADVIEDPWPACHGSVTCSSSKHSGGIVCVSLFEGLCCGCRPAQ